MKRNTFELNTVIIGKEEKYNRHRANKTIKQLVRQHTHTHAEIIRDIFLQNDGQLHSSQCRSSRTHTFLDSDGSGGVD